MRVIFKILTDIFGIPELRRRVLWTFLMLLIFRVGFHIYLPGINIPVFLKSFEQKDKGGGLLDWINYTSALTGGKFDTPVIFSLGIMPYISASIIFSLLVKVFPRLEALSKEGEQGRRLINRYTRYSTVLLCIIQSLFLVHRWQMPISPESGQTITQQSVFWIPLLQVLALTAGSLFLMWLGEKITEVGIGNGTSLLIMAGIVANMPMALAHQLSGIVHSDPDARPFEVVRGLFLLLLYSGVVAGVVFITKGQRRIAVQQQRSVKGRKVYGGQRSYMPLRVNPAGVLPIIFAQSLIVLPTGIIAWMASNFSPDSPFTKSLNFIHDMFSIGNFFYIVAYVGLIVFFTYFWTSLMFNPVEIANQMKEYGSFIPGIRPGKRTAEYLEKVMKRITLAGAAFLSAIALVPQLIHQALEVDFLVTTFLGGTGILIVVGVALDLVDKIEAQLLVRHYEGFMRGGGPAGGGGGGSGPRAPARGAAGGDRESSEGR
jgi:preprotein translocase subunit SecY